jgi:hypothetical protein
MKARVGEPFADPRFTFYLFCQGVTGAANLTLAHPSRIIYFESSNLAGGM